MMSIFQLNAYDEDFDPLRDPLPAGMLLSFGDQQKRACTVIGHRSPEEVDFALESLDWMLKQAETHHLLELSSEADRDGEAFTNRAKALKSLMPHFDLSGLESLPNASWADYFAALTLACIRETACDANFADPMEEAPLPPMVNPVTEDPHRSRYAIEWATEAVEAISYAERLVDNPPLNFGQNVRPDALTPAERGRRGGKKRGEPYQELRQALLEEYDQYHTRRTNRDAAKRLYHAHQERCDQVLRSDEPEKTLEKWIGEHAREKPGYLNHRGGQR